MRDQIITTFGLSRIGGRGGGATPGPAPLTIFDINEAAMTGTNLSNTTAVTFTATESGDGTVIDNTTWNSIVAFTTGLTVAGDMHVRQSVDFNLGGTIVTGISISDGVDRTRFLFYPTAGTLWVYGPSDRTGNIATGMNTIEAGNPTMVLDYYFRAADQSVSIFVSISGRAPHAFRFENITIGEIEINVKDGDPCTHTLESRSVSLPASLDIDPGLMHSPLGYTQRSLPTGFAATVPGGYAFYEDSGSYYASVSLAPPLSEADDEVMTLHVDLASGDDANPGTAALPLKSLHVAADRFQHGGRGIIKAKGGLYPYANCFRNYLKGAALQVVSWDGNDIISSMHVDTLSWTASGGAYVATLAVGNVSNVADAANPSAKGDHGMLAEAADVAGCQATAGTWFQSGTDVYVHPVDGRAPDADLRVYTEEVGGSTDIYGLHSRVSGSMLYLQDLHLEGGKFPLYVGGLTSTANITTYARDCTVKYCGTGSGFAIASSGLAVLENCVGAANSADGFNFQPASSGGDAVFALEIACIGRDNGFIADATCNGSSSHGAPVIRVNCLYDGNKNRNVHDIDQWGDVGMTWNMGCTARDPQTSYANWATGISAGTDVTKMWLDGCTSSGGAADIEANANSTVYYAGLTGDASNVVNNSATITPYVP